MKQHHFGAAKRILAEGHVDVKTIRDETGENLLQIAVGRGQTAIARRLIELGMDINARDNSGYTPLHEAARFGHRDCVALLLQNGADFSIADNYGDVPLETALAYGYTDVGKMLVRKGSKLDIFTASALGMTDQVRAFLDESKKQPSILSDHATDPTAQSRFSGWGGATPLHCAALGGNVEVGSLLISREESVFAKDNRGETPLFWAASQGKLEMAQFLVAHGASVNDTNRFGSTPLLIVARDAVAPKLVKFLIKAGANVNAKDQDGENALHQLAWYGYPPENVETAQALLDAGADINAKNHNRKTPLDVLLSNSMRNAALESLYRKYTSNPPPHNGK